MLFQRKTREEGKKRVSWIMRVKSGRGNSIDGRFGTAMSMVDPLVLQVCAYKYVSVHALASLAPSFAQAMFHFMISLSPVKLAYRFVRFHFLSDCII
jgi:hypothetical protein